MVEILTIVLVIAAVALIGLVLIQHGKGADMGASFGAGASGTVFGSGGSGNFLTRTTGILAVVFFICSLGLANLGARKAKVEDSLLQGPASAPAAEELPKADKPSAAADIPVDAGQVKPTELAPVAADKKAAPAVETPAKSSEKVDNSDKKTDNAEKK